MNIYKRNSSYSGPPQDIVAVKLANLKIEMDKINNPYEAQKQPLRDIPLFSDRLHRNELDWPDSLSSEGKYYHNSHTETESFAHQNRKPHHRYCVSSDVFAGNPSGPGKENIYNGTFNFHQEVASDCGQISVEKGKPSRKNKKKHISTKRVKTSRGKVKIKRVEVEQEKIVKIKVKDAETQTEIKHQEVIKVNGEGDNTGELTEVVRVLTEEVKMLKEELLRAKTKSKISPEKFYSKAFKPKHKCKHRIKAHREKTPLNSSQGHKRYFSKTPKNKYKEEKSPLNRFRPKATFYKMSNDPSSDAISVEIPQVGYPEYRRFR
ncbi:unnamed protein product [Moneuplotes crassus]|uniref:Uncharacterized protein n=1 Tax=Euplotes crassus TaxID=5936 RepID=A0AAD2CVF0_EUPCR|nr:unnamed protein product [Moneuplotes crassus]